MNFIIELDDGDFTKLEEEFQIVKIPNTGTAFVFCENEDIAEIKKLSNFVSVTPDNPSSISFFKAGLH